MGFLSKILNKNSSLYISLKSGLKGDKGAKYKKAYDIIKSLGLIKEKSYLKYHEDCRDNNLDCILHYLFYGQSMDDIAVKKDYIDVLDLDFYIENYGPLDEDVLIHYALEGFYKKYKVNSLDTGYINSLDSKAHFQFNEALNRDIELEIKEKGFVSDKKIVVPYIESNFNLKTDKLRVGVFINDPFVNLSACPYIRIVSPFRKLSYDDFIFFMYGMDSYSVINWGKVIQDKIFDVIIVERIMPFMTTILNSALANNIKLIYETDDDLLSLKEDNSSFEYVNRCRQEIINFIDNSSVVVVSTPELAKRFENKNVEVIRNYLVSDCLAIKGSINNNDRLKIGYFGTRTHSKDLNIIKEPIMKLKDNYDFDFQIIGGFDEDIASECYDIVELPDNSNDFEVFMKWLSKNAKWDIGIAPLEDSFFNKGKSELKYIEFTALGIPGVYSDVEVYNSVIKDGYNGFLAISDEDWFNKIELLIKDVTLRKEILSNATKDIIENYSIENRAKQWKDILMDLK